MMVKAERMLKKVQDKIGGDYWESQRGVPILTVGVYNVCYFYKRKSFRLFINNNEGKIDCKTYLDVISHLTQN